MAGRCGPPGKSGPSSRARWWRSGWTTWGRSRTRPAGEHYRSAAEVRVSTYFDAVMVAARESALTDRLEGPLVPGPLARTLGARSRNEHDSSGPPSTGGWRRTAG